MRSLTRRLHQPRVGASSPCPSSNANILQSLNASVNSIWVGRYLGEAALTATSNANVVMFLLIGIAFGIAMAATILVAQRIGGHDIAGARHAVRDQRQASSRASRW